VVEPAATLSRPADNALSFARPDEATLVVRLAATWRLRHGLPSARAVEEALAAAPAPHAVAFDTTALVAWDSSVLTFLARVLALCGERGITTHREGLPAGVTRLLALAETVPPKADARAAAGAVPIGHRIGQAALATADAAREMLAFLGEATLTLGAFLGGRARYRRSDLVVLVQQVGAEALPIVTLISFLVGLILAFVGAVQLQQFGASIYVANLVGIAMVREMGAMMTAIVMAGRSGAAFAAALGSMKVTQEIDALATMGISPREFLVLPRLIALCVMMPLLCLYSDFVGVLGGAAVGIGMLDLSATTYFQQTFEAVTITDLVGGVFKAAVYGVLIALSGCLRGMQSGKSSSAVGDATTSAVVTSIVLVVSACGVFAVVFYVLGI
jgi:phospholipid/cholesterol/gamma-HCH transport system permease protein